MFFDNWNDILKIAIAVPFIYLGLIVMLRISGKRTLTQMNIFDFVVTVALGSITATAIIANDTKITEGLLGLAGLILMQFILGWLYVRWPSFSKLIKSEPKLLFYKGEYKQHTMKAERIEKEELWQAARNQGLISMQQIQAIVLETNGKLSIIKPSDNDDISALQNVKME